MRIRLLPFGVAAALAGCAGRGASPSSAQPATAQPINFVSTRERDTVSVRYRGVAYVRRNEVDIVLHEARIPVTGPFTGAFRGFSIGLASGDPELSLRVQFASDRVDVANIHFANEALADSIVFRIRHVEPDSLAGMWFVLEEWRLWHRDGIPELAPVSVARSSDVFRPAAAHRSQ